MDIGVDGQSPRNLYKLLTGIVVPRPIAFVSTKSHEGILNVAPFSFFSVVTNNPPTIMFSIGETLWMSAW
ncbi:flavin reductase family protein [Bacillus dakarensis]|uniref:flavin reductase family protein n=1 Tax=Robertmurraya dakarensis TaxID=1926278 RepID=UPI0009FED7EB|nr:flavin reductase [Bacillus dakarensis]